MLRTKIISNENAFTKKNVYEHKTAHALALWISHDTQIRHTSSLIQNQGKGPTRNEDLNNHHQECRFGVAKARQTRQVVLTYIDRFTFKDISSFQTWRQQDWLSKYEKHAKFQFERKSCLRQLTRQCHFSSILFKAFTLYPELPAFLSPLEPMKSQLFL